MIKFFIYVFNCDQDQFVDVDFQVKMEKLVVFVEVIFLDVEFEVELVEMEFEDVVEFFVDVGIEEFGLDKFVWVGFDIFGLQIFLIVGEKEFCVWMIYKGDIVFEVVGVIYIDFQKGFIKVQVVFFGDFVEFGGEKEVQVVGKLWLEGKEYVMQDGDVVEF